jgi:uncharacterized protein DUF3810
MRRAGWAAVLLAAVAALAPVPRDAVERWYSRGVYRSIQPALTSLSNVTPVPLFDVLCLLAVAAVAVATYRVFQTTGRRGALRLVQLLLHGGAVVYLAFLAIWGLNYRRVPLTEKLSFDSARVTADAAGELAARTIVSLNRLYSPAHARTTTLTDLASAFHDAERALGSRDGIVPGRPKMTLLGGYFHYASIAGMTDPFFLETLIAPDLLDVERPFVVAHEWGHLAGYADESEANYVAWLTCLRGDERAQYSAWLALLGDLREFVPKSARLDAGPRGDLLALRYRYSGTSPMLRAAARESYDKYLKANRVESGIESYDLVVQLILGTQLTAAGDPLLRWSIPNDQRPTPK